MKTLLILSAALIGLSASAAPTLVAAPYLIGPDQPEKASFTVDGGVPIPCTLKLLAGGALQPLCDLASITVPGVYKLVMIVSNRTILTDDGTGGTYVVGGTAESAPFQYTFRRGVAVPPVVRWWP